MNNVQIHPLGESEEEKSTCEKILEDLDGSDWWDSILTSIKENPVAWAIGGGVAVVLLTGKRRR